VSEERSERGAEHSAGAKATGECEPDPEPTLHGTCGMIPGRPGEKMSKDWIDRY
jgi:hypothetical protein